MHANRVGQINRCLSEARGLLGLLRRAAPPPGGGAPAGGDWPAGAAEVRREAQLEESTSALALKQQTLAEHLLARRQYVSGEGRAEPSEGGGLGLHYDPRFLLFEFVHNIVLRPAQVAPRPRLPSQPFDAGPTPEPCS